MTTTGPQGIFRNNSNRQILLTEGNNAAAVITSEPQNTRLMFKNKFSE
jgi:hypothetical protein